MFFVVLFLGLAKTPLAYDCLPGSTDSHPVLTSGQGKNTNPPCQNTSQAPLSTPEKGHCCIIDIDYGVPGAKHGATLQTCSSHEPQQPDAVPASTGLYPASIPAYAIALAGRAGPVAIFHNQPAYLVTRRLRI